MKNAIILCIENLFEESMFNLSCINPLTLLRWVGVEKGGGSYLAPLSLQPNLNTCGKTIIVMIRPEDLNVYGFYRDQTFLELEITY